MKRLKRVAWLLLLPLYGLIYIAYWVWTGKNTIELDQWYAKLLDG